jgi:hypothetical protein
MSGKALDHSFSGIAPYPELIRQRGFVRCGSTTVLAAPERHFWSTPINGHRQTGPVGPFRAMSGSPTISTLLQVARRRLRIEHRPILMQTRRIIKEARAGVVYALG